MNRKAAAILFAICFLVSAAYPPWIRTYERHSDRVRTDAGYSFIWAPPIALDDWSTRLDLERLLVTWAFLGAGAFLASFVPWWKGFERFVKWTDRH